MGNRYRVRFEYADAMSRWQWRKQECEVYAKDPGEARRKCMDLYGLGVDCEYRITGVEIVK